MEHVSRHPHRNKLFICKNPYKTNASCVSYSDGFGSIGISYLRVTRLTSLGPRSHNDACSCASGGRDRASGATPLGGDPPCTIHPLDSSLVLAKPGLFQKRFACLTEACGNALCAYFHILLEDFNKPSVLESSLPVRSASWSQHNGYMHTCR